MGSLAATETILLCLEWDLCALGNQLSDSAYIVHDTELHLHADAYGIGCGGRSASRQLRRLVDKEAAVPLSIKATSPGIATPLKAVSVSWFLMRLATESQAASSHCSAVAT